MPLARTTAIGATSPSLAFGNTLGGTATPWANGTPKSNWAISYATPFREPLNRWDLAQVLLLYSIV